MNIELQGSASNNGAGIGNSIASPGVSRSGTKKLQRASSTSKVPSGSVKKKRTRASSSALGVSTTSSSTAVAPSSPVLEVQPEKDKEKLDRYTTSPCARGCSYLMLMLLIGDSRVLRFLGDKKELLSVLARSYRRETQGKMRAVCRCRPRGPKEETVNVPVKRSP